MSPELVFTSLCVAERKNVSRLVTYIFLVDSSHAIFHRTPPKLTLSEITGSLPCAEELFAMRSPCPHLELDWHQSFSKVSSVAKAMSLLMGDRWTDESLGEFGRLSHLDLFILISGTHLPMDLLLIR